MRVRATDATPSAGGACEARVSRELCEALRCTAETKGGNVRTESSNEAIGDSFVPTEDPVATVVCQSID